MSPVLGAIADDFTGGTDLASTWARQGLRVIQTIGVPEDAWVTAGSDAIVVALKTRTAPKDVAVAESVAAHRWLTSVGVQQIVFKYCSTFDSTPAGNIGPVTDALLDEAGDRFTIICPAFPANLRTVYQGHLFVGSTLLSDSPMRDHPLTPMREASLIRLMAAQTDRPVGLIPLAVVRAGVSVVERCISDLRATGVVHAVTDALTDDDLRIIGAAIKGLPLVTEGSGIGMGLTQNFRDQGLLARPADTLVPDVPGRELVLSGSCSAATRAQLDDVAGDWPSRRITTDELADWAAGTPGALPVVIYASATPDALAEAQARYGAQQAGQMVEEILGGLAARLQHRGFSRIVVAGGETSGAGVLPFSCGRCASGPRSRPACPGARLSAAHARWQWR
jgi:uncharacterized protein YgbK (DUF1537 family)